MVHMMTQKSHDGRERLENDLCSSVEFLVHTLLNDSLVNGIRQSLVLWIELY